MRKGKTPPKNKNKAISPVVKQTFDKLSNGRQIMNDEEIFGFLGDTLQIPADDPFVGHLIINVMKLEKLEQVSMENFNKLFEDCKAKNVDQLKKKLPNLRKEASFDKQYRNMYRKIFDLYIGAHTTLDMETAEQLWLVYLKPKLKFYKEFEEYLGTLQDKETVKVHRDLWNMMLQFSFDVANLNTDYNEEDGWPVFVDNFVEFIKQKQK